ncbi:MAG: hypothetical protein Q9219_005048 [cf. Caloplaca sp. 3 TL-2023]
MLKGIWTNTWFSIGRNRHSFAVFSYQRHLSTNSAINRGLRKSRHGRSRFDPPARLGGVTQRSQPGGDRRSLRNDEGTSFAPSKRGPTLRQRRSLEAKDNPAGRSQYGFLGSEPRRTQRLDSRLPITSTSQKQSGRIDPKARPLNRAQRRAAAFGHREHPPEGYKGKRLPNDSIKSQHRLRTHPEVDQYFSRGQPIRDPHPDYNDRFSSKRSAEADVSSQRKGPDRKEGKFNANPEEQPRRKSQAPLAIPYTTPASEFLYGHSVVTTALKASRRAFYRLYLYNGDTAEVRGQDSQVRKLALAANVEVQRVGRDWLKLMDKMSGGRPHNGYVLEASPLPKLPVTALQSVQSPQPTFKVALNHQSQEEEAINGNNPVIPYGTGYTHFLGADGLLICTRNSAALNPVTLKAAAGAAEFLPIFSVDQPATFIDDCQQNGWKFYAAVSPTSPESGRATRRPSYSTSTMGDPTQKHPCILILGSEGDGLRWNIQRKADYLLGIEGQRNEYGDVDSLNVSVAAALLCHAFLKLPKKIEDYRSQDRRSLNDALPQTTKGENDHMGLIPDKSGSTHVATQNERLF